MDTTSLSKLLGLCATALVALAASWMLLRYERRPAKLPLALREGYPHSEFPRRELLDGPLARLCQSQSSLLALYGKLPAASPARAGLLVFLQELRALMDGAYQLAALQASSAAAGRLERLVSEAQGAVLEMARMTEQHLNESGELLIDAELEVRLHVMRALARELDDTEGAVPRG